MLVDEGRPVGNHQVKWNGTNASGSRVSSGVYIAKLEVEDETTSTRVVVIK